MEKPLELPSIFIFFRKTKLDRSGCRWSIGVGTRICVMHDPWLQDNRCGCVPSPKHTSVYSLSVCDLMSPDEHIWDFTRIEDLFPAKVAHVIVDRLFSNINLVDK